MSSMHEFASQEWKRIGDLREEIIDELEGEGERQAFEEAVRDLGEQLAGAQTVEEREAWAKAVLALIEGVPEVGEALEELEELDLHDGGSFGFDDETEAHGKSWYEQMWGKSEKEARIKQNLFQPAEDEKSLSLRERLRRFFGMKG